LGIGEREYDFNIMKTLVIYHADCLDGYGAAWQRLGNKARYLSARHGDSFPRFEPGETPWQSTHPHLFRKKVYYLTGLGSYSAG
jgi:hypothetical protein